MQIPFDIRGQFEGRKVVIKKLHRQVIIFLLFLHKICSLAFPLIVFSLFVVAEAFMCLFFVRFVL